MPAGNFRRHKDVNLYAERSSVRQNDRPNAKGAMMTPQMLKVGKERLVVLRERDYKKLLAQIGTEHKLDAGDAAESRRRMKEPGGTKLTQLKKKLGL